MMEEITVDRDASKKVVEAVQRLGEEDVGRIALETGLSEMTVMGALVLKAQAEQS